MSEANYLTFDKDSPESEMLLKWWKELEGDRGDRAALKRCQSLTEVIFIPAYHSLRQKIAPYGTVNYEGLAVIAGLTANVKNIAGSIEIAEQMAIPKTGGSSARVSGLRFRRLLKIHDRNELYSSMRRIVRLLDGSVNLRSLAKSVYWWNEYTKKEWAYEYYSKAPSED